jgi:hypothetical protein
MTRKKVKTPLKEVKRLNSCLEYSFIFLEAPHKILKELGGKIFHTDLKLLSHANQSRTIIMTGRPNLRLFNDKLINANQRLTIIRLADQNIPFTTR